MMKTMFRRIAPAMVLGASLPVMAEVSVPNTFQAGQTARASEVNANFEALRSAIEDLQEQTANLRELNEHVEVMDDPNVEGGVRVVFKGVNVQIHNGDETVRTNGLGNLIVGFGGDRTKGNKVCTGPSLKLNKNDCINDPDFTWSLNPKSGSHNVVIGENNAYGGDHALIAGTENVTVFGQTAIGNQHEAYSGGSVIIGGSKNRAIAGATLLGTSDSEAFVGTYSTIVGGRFNTINNVGGSVFGAWNSQALSKGSVVVGGNNGSALGDWSSVVGGKSNETKDVGAAVLGGELNTASGLLSVLLGGSGNTVSGDYSAIIGNQGQTVSADNTVSP